MSRISLRRLRQDPHIRALTRETRPHPEQFIQPLFVVEGLQQRETIPGLTGVYRDTPASLLAQIESDLAAGVSKFLLFGVPAAACHARHRLVVHFRRRSPPSRSASARTCGWQSMCACAPRRRTAIAAC